jgi:hypothetical protein
MLICRALLKHGHINFSLEILEYCQPSQILPIEDKYFKLLKPSYNILKKAPLIYSIYIRGVGGWGASS